MFLFDFALRMKRSSSPGAYFFHGSGWLDLPGSIPSLGLLRITALLRIARLSRLTRVLRLFQERAVRRYSRRWANDARMGLDRTVIAAECTRSSAIPPRSGP